VVKGWRKIKLSAEDPDHPGLIVKGQPFPYSAANLDFLMKNSYEFSTFVNDHTMNARAFLEEEEKAEIKNS